MKVCLLFGVEPECIGPGVGSGKGGDAKLRHGKDFGCANMYLKRIHIENIRCFEEFDLEFDLSGEKPGWTVIVGDNASGKTTLLRSIAIGLCDQSSAAGLLKESDTGYVRFQTTKGKIIIELADLQENSKQEYRIETSVESISTKTGGFETVVQETHPDVRNFPWHRLFVAGYGAGRGTSGTGDIAGYSVINAVYNMFSYTEGLQNPELIIRRLMEPKLDKEVERVLKEIMRVHGIEGVRSGIRVSGESWGGKMPLRDLADGYKSTFLWVTDLVGWAFSFDGSIKKANDIEGIVIIDELEQHLHATWQREVIDRLKRVFPKVQFIAATHSPLIAGTVGPLGPSGSADKLVLCELSEDNRTVKAEELQTMQGYRFQQVLASRAFKYLCEANPALEWSIRRASELTDKGSERSQREEAEYQDLKEKLKGAPFLRADSSAQREIEEEKLNELKRLEGESKNDQS
ncbi:MAG: AAA family ATPase [Planctomycetota bacterium]|jgi:predicted ATP-binding protein involved in virulence